MESVYEKLNEQLAEAESHADMLTGDLEQIAVGDGFTPTEVGQLFLSVTEALEHCEDIIASLRRGLRAASRTRIAA